MVVIFFPNPDSDNTWKTSKTYKDNSQRRWCFYIMLGKYFIGNESTIFGFFK
jgi:hypothetical protein